MLRGLSTLFEVLLLLHEKRTCAQKEASSSGCMLRTHALAHHRWVLVLVPWVVDTEFCRGEISTEEGELSSALCLCVFAISVNLSRAIGEVLLIRQAAEMTRNGTTLARVAGPPTLI